MHNDTQKSMSVYGFLLLAAVAITSVVAFVLAPEAGRNLKFWLNLTAILADTYKNSLKKYPQALDRYTDLLAFPDLGAADKCDLLLARADTRFAMGQATEAEADLSAASGLCSKPEDLFYIRAHAAASRSLPGAASHPQQIPFSPR